MTSATHTDRFRRFVEDNWAALLRTATLLAGSRQSGDDLMQEALIRVLSAWRRVDQDRALAYTRKVMANLTTDRWRRKRFEPVLIEDAQIARQGSDDERLTSLIDRDDILRRLALLQPRERAMVVLRYYCDLSEREVAEQLACSIGTVKSTCSRALRKLRSDVDAVLGA